MLIQHIFTFFFIYLSSVIFTTARLLQIIFVSLSLYSLEVTDLSHHTERRMCGIYVFGHFVRWTLFFSRLFFPKINERSMHVIRSHQCRYSCRFQVSLYIRLCFFHHIFNGRFHSWFIFYSVCLLCKSNCNDRFTKMPLLCVNEANLWMLLP